MTRGKARWILPLRRLVTLLLSRIGGTKSSKVKTSQKLKISR